MSQVTVDQALQRATRHHQAGQLQQAESMYRQVLATHPDHPDALNLLGLLALQMGQPHVALELVRRALSVQPSAPSYHLHLGQALAQLGQEDAAIEAYQKALVLRPGYPEALNSLGNVLRVKGQIDEAIAMFRETIAKAPASAGAYNNLGTALLGKGEFGQSIEAFRRAIELQPNLAEAHSNLGMALRETGQVDEAIGEYRQAVSWGPNIAMAHYNLGQALLLKGDFAEGWAEHEWRWKVKELDLPPRDFALPMWDGSDLKGKRILLLAEQGFGDTINFSRYAPIVAEHSGGRVILGCQAELLRLMKSLEGVEKWITHGDPLPPFEVYCPLLSLPLVMKTNKVKDIPAAVPYLRADPELSSLWRQRIPKGMRNIGLVWSGRSTLRSNLTRSLPLAMLEPLASVPRVNLFSLQKGEAAKDLQSAPASMTIRDVASELNDFADTAALIDNLDMIITIDTAVAHLAGAMGKPVWVLLPFAPDWRWLLERTDSPWYRTMRLFRQPSPGDWSTVIQNVVRELQSAS